MSRNILCLSLFFISTCIICYQEGFLAYLGIFLLLWSNNIGIMQNVENLQKKEKSILKILFGANAKEREVDEIMSHNMKVSDK